MRMIKIIISELINDKLKIEEELERVINDESRPVNERTIIIKQLLKDSVLLDQSIIKFREYLNEEITDNTN